MVVYLNHRKDDSNVQMKTWKLVKKGFQKRDRMTFGWKVSKKLLEEVQNNQFSETINGDTKASVS